MYEWLANDWMGKGKTEEALITCARWASARQRQSESSHGCPEELSIGDEDACPSWTLERAILILEKSLCRAAGLIPEWGAIHWAHSKIITKVGGREMEARDCARAALQMPLWTIGPDLKQVMILSLPDCSMGVSRL
jgi:hypothetical protein